MGGYSLCMKYGFGIDIKRLHGGISGNERCCDWGHV